MSTTWLLILSVQYIGIGISLWYEGRPGLGVMAIFYAAANGGLIYDLLYGK